MPSTSAPSDAPARGWPVWHYDGVSAVRRRAMLAVEGDAFRLIEDARETGPFAFTDLLPGVSGADSFALRGRAGWRIGFEGGVPDELRDSLPGAVRYGRVVDRFGLWPATAIFAVVAVVVVTLFLQTPALVARAVPASVDRRLGDLMVGDFGRNGCAAPAGTVALDALVTRIDPADPSLEVHVVKLPIVNAVTLPGGRIVIFDGLIQAARSPDEVAGVIGHEIGHVRHRDGLESLVRALGLSVLLGGLDGNVGGYTNALLAATYSRDAEARADGYAITLMKDADISPVPTAAFFQRLGGKSAKAERMLAYFASHPVSIDRAARFTRSAVKGEAYRPALDPGEWRALRTICAGAKDAPRWRF